MCSLYKYSFWGLLIFSLLFHSACRFQSSKIDRYFSPGYNQNEASLSYTVLSGSNAFGNVEIFQTSDLTVTITNSGDRKAENITSTFSSTGFQYKGGIFPGTGGSCSSILNGNSDCTMVLEFLPIEFISYESDFSTTYLDGKNGAQIVTLSLSGSGVSIPPTITGITPTTGLYIGGTIVTISGEHFRAGMIVTIGGNDCTSVQVISYSELTCLTAAHTIGAVDVTLTNNNAQSVTSANAFTYVYPTPTVTTVDPNVVTVEGGTTLTITGTNFITGATVTVGGSACTSPNVLSSTTITCSTPSGTDGSSVDVIVTNLGGPTETLGNAVTYSQEIWVATSTTSQPSIRYFHTAVWTGSKMVIWGGGDGSTNTNTGALYDWVTDSWTASTTTSAPSAVATPTALWSGSKVIVLTGVGLLTGGKYDPLTDSWTSISSTNAPTVYARNSAVWTGERLIAWSGSLVAIRPGGIYDPNTDSWTVMDATNAPGGRTSFSTVWTGAKMILWGGVNITAVPSAKNDGGIYDPYSNTWSTLTTSNAPVARSLSNAVWTGAKMLVWGGYDNDNSQVLNTGGSYNLNTNTWTSLSTTGAPSARYYHNGVWTGSRMIIWAGFNLASYLNTGGVYDPETDNWVSTTTLTAPSIRSTGASVWTGGKMIVQGGLDGSALNSGGVYTPPAPTGSGAWTSITTTSAPAIRYEMSAVWTGSKMIVWGGKNGPLNTGGQYDPVTNSWSATTTTGAPSIRSKHMSVWTGAKMIIWGGWLSAAAGAYNDGSLYDPVANSWSAMTTTDAPTPRSCNRALVSPTYSSAVWTGARMIVWGGGDSNGVGGLFDDGAFYDPNTDTWSSLTAITPPSARGNHSAVWTGSKMIIWGGLSSASYRNTGSVFDPGANTWTSTTTTGAPLARQFHSALWTGNKMIIWGGIAVSPFNTGALYDPNLNSWTTISTVNVPIRRYLHNSVWTGSRMLVWAGWNTSSLNSGGLYNPFNDTWASLTTTNAPAFRYDAAGIWTGGKMIIFGGAAAVALNTGGIYVP